MLVRSRLGGLEIFESSPEVVPWKVVLLGPSLPLISSVCPRAPRFVIFLFRPSWPMTGTFASMSVVVHLKNGPVARAVLAEVPPQQMKLAVLRQKCLFTQVAIVDCMSSSRVEIIGAGVGIIALLHVLPPRGWPDDPWLLWIAEMAVKDPMCSPLVS